MKPQEINERIAKLCGWFPVEDTESGLWHLSNMDGRKIGYRSALSENHAWRVLCPDYCHSLDACREFETEIDAKEWSDALLRVIQDKRSMLSAIDARYCTATATPIERCEAFLRMKGQWE